MLTIATETDGTRLARRRRATTPDEILDVRRARLAKLSKPPSDDSLRALAWDLVCTTGLKIDVLADMLAAALRVDEASDDVKRPQRRLLLVMRYDAFMLKTSRSERRRVKRAS